MNHLLTLFLSATLLLTSSVSGSIITTSATSSNTHKAAPLTVPNSYIVKLKPATSVNTIHSFLDSYNQRGDLEGGPKNVITRSYSPKIFNGFAGSFSPAFLKELKAQYGSRIEYIEPNKVAHILAPTAQATGEQPNPPSWGLTRISQRSLDLSAPFRYPSTSGKGVEAWIVDTGCDPSNDDFGGRATMVKSFIDGEDAVDLNGHGTHVSGTIGSATYGIAKQVTIKCVKVLDADGSGTYEGVIAGIDFVAQTAAKNRAVMNMSLGGPKSQAVDDAVAAAIKAGVVVIVAAGNETQDACNVSPAGAKGVLAVGATDNTDSLAYFSNTGSCVGILAPGVDITSLWISGQATNTISGTSMASPHVVGVAALLLGEKTYPNVAAVYTALKSFATPNKIQKVGKTTVNKLVYNNVA